MRFIILKNVSQTHETIKLHLETNFLKTKIWMFSISLQVLEALETLLAVKK